MLSLPLLFGFLIDCILGDPYSLPRYPVSFAVSMETFAHYFDGVLEKGASKG